MSDMVRRDVEPEHNPEGQLVSFADGYPFLLIGEAALADLNTRLAQPVPMNRFRPNLVFGGGAAYEDDGWKQFLIGDVPFRAVRGCGRCVLTTIDQATATKSPIGEPLRTLATYRKAENSTLFGQNVTGPGRGPSARGRRPHGARAASEPKLAARVALRSGVGGVRAQLRGRKLRFAGPGQLSRHWLWTWRICLEFLARLAANNTTAWMAEHRADYQRARAACTELVRQVLAQAAASDPDLAALTPSDVTVSAAQERPRPPRPRALQAPHGRGPEARGPPRARERGIFWPFSRKGVAGWGPAPFSPRRKCWRPSGRRFSIAGR